LVAVEVTHANLPWILHVFDQDRFVGLLRETSAVVEVDSNNGPFGRRTDDGHVGPTVGIQVAHVGRRRANQTPHDQHVLGRDAEAGLWV
jgi:hypothetical protein